MGRVAIGMNPHKRSVTIEVMAGDETILGGGRFATTVDGHAAMRAYVKAWRDRVWAIEGCAGIGPSGAARLLVEVADITRFPDKGHFASWNGTAPIDASPGDQIRHRLSRAGNRQINRVLHIMATVQLRNATAGRAYYDHKKAEGKTSTEAMRALKRRLSDVDYRTMLNDAIPGAPSRVTGPGGHPGATTKSSAADSHPDIDTSDKSLPGPATRKPTTPLPAAS